MLHITEENIGGAYVRRTFTNNGRQMKRGDPALTREEVLSIPRSNRVALIEGVFIEVYPMAPGGSERFMINVGNNEYNVIEGRVVNTDPLQRKEAEKLVRA